MLVGHGMCPHVLGRDAWGVIKSQSLRRRAIAAYKEARETSEAIKEATKERVAKAKAVKREAAARQRAAAAAKRRPAPKPGAQPAAKRQKTLQQAPPATPAARAPPPAAPALMLAPPPATPALMLAPLPLDVANGAPPAGNANTRAVAPAIRKQQKCTRCGQLGHRFQTCKR